MSPQEATRLLIAQAQDGALESLVASGYAEEGVARAYLEHRRNSGATETVDFDQTKKFSKGMTSMHASFRKTLIDAGYVPSIRKGIYYDALTALGQELQRDGDSPQQAFARGMDTPEGVALHALYKAAPPDLSRDFVEQPKPLLRGAANIELEIEASRLRSKNPKLTHAQAVTAIYTSAEHAELVRRVKMEDLAGPRTPAGQTSVGRNPNWNADVTRTMARLR